MKLKLSYRPFRVLMADRNVTRKELSESVGINRNTIGRLYNDVEVSIDTVRLICEYLNCRIEDVVEFVIIPHIIDTRGITRDEA